MDSSKAMLSHALDHPAVRYARGSAEAMPLRSSAFDLITTCSAFHWFDATMFLAEARRVSTPDAWLVVYDNYISEMEEEPTFHNWFFDNHLSAFPTPPRNRADSEAVIAEDRGFALHGNESYDNFVRMTKRSLIDYLLSQTNMIAKVEGEGMSLARVEERLSEELEPFFRERAEGTFRFQGPIVYARKRPD